MGATNKLTDVAPSKVAETVAMFEAEGAEVTTEEQPDGNFTIIATKPNGNHGEGD